MLLLNISQQYAKISLDSKPPQIQLQTAPAELNIETEAATVEIHSPQGKLTIDSTAMRASYGIKTREQMIREDADRGMQAAQEFVAKTAEDGDRLGNYARSGATVTQLAAESSIKAQKEITWAWLEPPEIHYEAQPVEFQVQPGSIQFNPTSATFDNQLNWGEVNVGMQQYQSVKFWTTEASYATMDIRA
ncbi:DUF6470 family protein [Azotosporobacter soli]|uniref:DUF6470 family protein n=1 Tax=Azotosporobacter soli TaxID=3055040 RepID=UPI0031FE60CB